MRRTDARSAGIHSPAGVARRFHVSLYKVEPCKAVTACNLLAKDCDRPALADEVVESGPQVPLVRSPLSFACRPKWWALENPVGKLVRYLGRPRMYFQPCDFGDPYTKRTCLWGNFVPPLPLIIGETLAVPPTEGSKMWAKYGGKGMTTKNARSATPKGFAQAFFVANP